MFSQLEQGFFGQTLRNTLLLLNFGGSKSKHSGSHKQREELPRTLFNIAYIAHICVNGWLAYPGHLQKDKMPCLFALTMGSDGL